MNTQIHRLHYWAKTSEQPLAKGLRAARRLYQQFEIPNLPSLFNLLRTVHKLLFGTLEFITRVFWYTPVFKSYLQNHPKRLYLFGGLPSVLGNLNIHIGDDCQVAGKITLAGRGLSTPTPSLKIGHHVVIGWQSKISVGTRVEIGNDCYIAGNCNLSGYPGHPIDPVKRALHLPDEEHQIGDIVLGNNVWLGHSVTILPGVTVGENSVIGTGSIVTHNIPANSLAAGIPAKVIKNIGEEGHVK